jgi:hypothetical protein
MKNSFYGILLISVSQSDTFFDNLVAATCSA